MTDRKLTEAEMITYLQLGAELGNTARLAPEEAKTLLDLINRQRAEIERLHSEVKEKTETIDFLKDQAVGWSIDFCNLKAKLNTAKSEAVKEFAERLKKRLERKYTIFVREYVLRHLRELVKEMTEERTE